MNIWLNRLKLFMLLGIGLACIACFFVLSLSLLVVGVALGCILFCIQVVKNFFRPRQKQPPLTIDEDGHLVIEHDPSA